MSNLQFTLYDQQLTEKEANALISLAKKESPEPIKIEISKIVKLKKLNIKQLFELSVTRKDENLAQLAWRLSVAPSTAKFKNTTYRKNPIPHQIPQDQISTDTVVSKICNRKSNWAAGGAIILWAIYQSEVKPEDGLTLRTISELFLNRVWFDDLLQENSPVFKGFNYYPNTEKAWEAHINKSDSDNRENYYGSPLYSALRSGLLWVKHHGLVDTQEAVSVGRVDGLNDSNTEKMQRKYYTVHPTLFGIDTMKVWDDCIDVAINYFLTLKD
jgi:hypothetical protein